jgi:tRNA threonylcarbamoyladenosine biosynthesis protein TsaE
VTAVVSLLCESQAATENLGHKLAQSLEPGDVITLRAALGGGKTTLARGICRGLGISEEEVSSPTFVLLHIYQGRLPVYHFDLYRLKGPEELHPIGAEDYLWGDGVALVEWPGVAQDILPPDRLEITLDADEENQDLRTITLEGRGRWRQRLDELKLAGSTP